MINQTVLRGAVIFALLTTVVACGGGSSSDSASTVSSTSTSTSSTSSTSSSASSIAAVALAASAYVVPTSSTSAVITVNRMGGATGAVSAGYATVNGTATAGTDYSYTTGTLSWASGDNSAKTISVPVKAAAAGKSFSVQLTSVAGAAGFGSPSSATVAMSGSAAASSSSSAGGSSPSASTASSTCTSSSPTSSTTCLLAFINGLSGQTRHILAGQHANYWDSNPLDIVTPIPGATGGQIAILGTSNFWLNSDGVTSSTTSWFVSSTNAWLAQGGLVLVSQEPINPFASGEAIADIWTPGTNANTKWKAYLDTQVALFKQITGTVMWRPFPEPNGNHFGDQFTPAQFQTFWQYTHTYMVSQGLTNVLWVFNLNYWDPNNQASQWYPGDAYVDIVSIDSYPPDSNSDNVYNFYLTTGKPIMFAEAGVNGLGLPFTGNNSTVLSTIKSSFSKAFAVVVWCQTWALQDQAGEDAFMTDPAVVTLSDIPAAFANQ